MEVYHTVCVCSCVCVCVCACVGAGERVVNVGGTECMYGETHVKNTADIEVHCHQDQEGSVDNYFHLLSTHPDRLSIYILEQEVQRLSVFLNRKYKD